MECPNCNVEMRLREGASPVTKVTFYMLTSLEDIERGNYHSRTEKWIVRGITSVHECKPCGTVLIIPSEGL